MATESENNPAPRRQKVQAAEIGTDILRGLAELAPSTSLSRLAEHLEMPASKVHRYLQALMASGFAEQDPRTNHYGLGQAALFVGLAAIGRLDVVKLAGPVLTELRDRLNQTCFLAIWGNHGPVVVSVEQAVGAVTLVTQVGSVLPLLGSSTGQVFAAYLPRAQTAALSEQESGRPGAPDSEHLQRVQSQIRANGIHAVQGLLMPGVNAVSVPLFGAGEQLTGVITMVGSAAVFDADPRGSAARSLQAAGQTITERMCGVPPVS
ncbi:IclR family transcriptional regulator [Pseudomonas oligotrophica]|uniref:IclR family transcriptional regulator n=1 Tax=Pseudomonas oligotrophica TaxID=2912055 RepID=UPI001F1E73D4|nr:IclR family transcriptional regulator [Pseudomonas oligotrophica]MCF7203620.1 IclR family transcriptional regulator [Pseudomonas oligotrophica]